jgi:hypothetical protein
MEIRVVTSRLYQMAEAITGRLLIKDLTKRAVEFCKGVMRADACSIFLVADKEPESV